MHQGLLPISGFMEGLGIADPTFFSMQDLRSWLRDALYGPKSPLVLVSIWFAWCAHNTICIGKEEVILLYRVILNVKNLTSLFWKGLQGHQENTIVERWVAWHQSREAVTVLSVNGSYVGN